MESSTRQWTSGQRYAGWSVERVRAEHRMRLLVSAQPVRSFAAIGAVSGPHYLVEISTPHVSQDEQWSAGPAGSWDWTLEIGPVTLPVGAPGVPDEEVRVRLNGAGTPQPSLVELTPRSVAPYVAERARLLG